MDPVTSNFILTIVGIGVGSIVTLIGAISKCMMKSRCTQIECCCSKCTRDVLSEDNEMYHEPNTPKE